MGVTVSKETKQSNLLNALAKMVGAQTPTDPEILLSGGNFHELYRLSQDPGILKSVGTLNVDARR